MTVAAFSRGHEIRWGPSTGVWHYVDTGEPYTNERVCVRCGEGETLDGHDACLGTIKGAEFACCGHGVEEGYKVMYGERVSLDKEDFDKHG